jgi:hypothetical protein
MQLAELPELDVGRHARTEADHHVGVVFLEVDEIERALQVQLYLRKLLREIHQRRRREQRVESVGDADAHGPGRLAAFRLQVAGDRVQRVVEPRQRPRQRLSLMPAPDSAGLFDFPGVLDITYRRNCVVSVLG